MAPTERHYAFWQYDRMAQRDPQTSRPHNETGQEHWGLLKEGGWRWWGLAVGGAIGTCQSSCSPQRMCWTSLSPSVSEGWQLQTETCTAQLAHISQAEWIYHKTETDNTAQPCSSDGEGTLIKSVCAHSVCVCVCVDKRASLSSPWQITTCIRLKEDLRQRLWFAQILLPPPHHHHLLTDSPLRTL